MHGVNEKLGRHRSDCRLQCSMSGDECESMSDVLW